jgi:putative addiction module killer protein
LLITKVRRVVDYLKQDGLSPFEEWFKHLKSSLVKSKVTARVQRAALGNFGKFRNLGEIYELKEDFGPGYRIYFGLVKDEIILLLAGGDKSTQDQDIKKALAYWHDFERRDSKI